MTEAPEEQHSALRPRDQLPPMDRLRDGAGVEKHQVSPVLYTRVTGEDCEVPMVPDYQCDVLIIKENEAIEKETTVCKGYLASGRRGLQQIYLSV
jgi:hypothetical protein